MINVRCQNSRTIAFNLLSALSFGRHLAPTWRRATCPVSAGRSQQSPPLVVVLRTVSLSPPVLLVNGGLYLERQGGQKGLLCTENRPVPGVGGRDPGFPEESSEFPKPSLVRWATPLSRDEPDLGSDILTLIDCFCLPMTHHGGRLRRTHATLFIKH